MNIKDQTNYVLSHPALAEAINQFQNGDTEKMYNVLFCLQLHTIDVQIKNSAKEYGSCKRMNSSDIKESLLNMRQPDNLNLFLPIPKVKEPEPECQVINFIDRIKRKAARYFNPLQLSLFPEIEQLAVSY